MDNAEIAGALEEVAQHLEETGTRLTLAAAYRAAASTIRWLDRPVSQILAEAGEAGLRRLHHIDDRTVGSIEELATAGHLELLDQLRADVEPSHVFDRVPGIGDALAQAIEMRLGIVTEEELLLAAWDGRLEGMPEIGLARANRIREALRRRLGRRPMRTPPEHPTVAELLAVDQEYRARAAAGELHTIAPQHNNPKREAWLPVLHTQRGAHHYTALFSNTDLAHRLHKTDDWVILYHFEAGRVRQDMAATESQGDLAGRRVICGREQETREHYQREREPAS